MSIWGKTYKNLIIKSDFRVHEKVGKILNQIQPDGLQILDIATGNGALAERVFDTFPKSKIDINDYEKESEFNKYRNIFHVDLNEDFTKNFARYDCILAIEIIEHLQNPWHFISNLKKLISDNGFIILSTPNTDSFIDRLHFLIEGNSFYFGEAGYEKSGGHITQVPDWLIQKIVDQNGMVIAERSFVDTSPHFGKKKFLLSMILYPIYKIFSKRKNNRSINIYVLRNQSK